MRNSCLFIIELFYFYLVIFVDFGRSITIIVIRILKLRALTLAKWSGKKPTNNYSRLKHVFSTSKHNKTRPREAMMDDNSVPSLFVDTP